MAAESAEFAFGGAGVKADAFGDEGFAFGEVDVERGERGGEGTGAAAVAEGVAAGLGFTLFGGGSAGFSAVAAGGFGLGGGAGFANEHRC